MVKKFASRQTKEKQSEETKEGQNREKSQTKKQTVVKQKILSNLTLDRSFDCLEKMMNEKSVDFEIAMETLQGIEELS